MQSDKPMKKRKGFRKGKTPDDYLELTDLEKKAIEKYRELNTLKKGSTRFRIALELDPVRRLKIRDMKNISLRMGEIRSAHSKLDRLSVQLLSGDITEEIRDGVTMMEFEVQAEIERANDLIWAGIKDLHPDFASLTQVIGCTDGTMKNSILTEEEFDKYVKGIEEELKALGYDLFDSDIEVYS